MGWLWRLAAGVAVAALLGACNPNPPTPSSSPASVANGPCTSIALAASRPSPITAGQAVVLTATAKGCGQPQFRFVLADTTAAAGSVTQDWSSTSTWTWNTFTTAPGRYVVRADARATSAGDSPPDASAYRAYVLRPGAAAVVPSCKLPVSGSKPGSGGFLEMPGGTFTADPASNVAMPGQSDPSGLRRGYTYDPVHGRWLPVPRDWVMPDFSSYVYVGTEYPRVSNQPALHVVNVASGADAQWKNGDQLYGLPIALRPEGVYGAPGPEIITMLDPEGVATTVDQGHNGEFAVITATSIWATKWSTGSTGQFLLADVQRIDLNTQSATDWFVRSGETVLPIGVDGAGNPIIAAGTQLPNGRIGATQIWIATQPSTGPVAKGALIYSDAAHPLTIIGWPIVSAGAVWIETDRGLWVDQDPATPMTLVASYSGYIAGGCV